MPVTQLKVVKSCKGQLLFILTPSQGSAGWRLSLAKSLCHGQKVGGAWEVCSPARINQPSLGPSWSKKESSESLKRSWKPRVTFPLKSSLPRVLSGLHLSETPKGNYHLN